MTTRRPALLIAAALTLTAAAGCSSSPAPITAHGMLTVYDSPFSGLSMADAYPDITDGSQVTVTDPSGTVFGNGTLSYSKADTLRFLLEAEAQYPQIGATLASDIAIYTFTVTVPGGEPRYGIQAGRNRGTIWQSAAQMKAGPGLTLGSLTG